MIVDGRQLPDGERLEADLCIIGAGAAGITLAMELANQGISVLVLESGGEEYEEETQNLYAGRNVGHPYYSLDVTRLRYLGGTTNHWAGWTGKLPPHSMRARAWVPHSGWPIAPESLDPYYARAAEYIELPPLDGKPRDLGALGSEAAQRLGLASGLIRFSPPTRFGKRYRPALKAASNVRVMLNVNVTDLRSDDGPNSISGVGIKTLNGKRSTATAKFFVLAVGGLEVPRLLLASKSTHAQGVGNQNDLVGRFFHEHLELVSGVVFLSAPQSSLIRFVAEQADGPLNYLTLSEEAQQADRLLDTLVTLHEVYALGEVSEGFAALRRMIRAVQNAEFPSNFWSDLGHVFGDIDEVADYTYGRLTGRRMTDRLLAINTRVEQRPDRESRVSLDSETDQLGMPRIKLDWRLHSEESESIRQMQVRLGRLLGELGIGRVRVDMEENATSWSPGVQGGHHHMGTARMSADPKQGVVDAQCKVHGIENLYIGGCAVFPTGGRVAPTYTIVALAVRMAEHLKIRLKTNG